MTPSAKKLDILTSQQTKNQETKIEFYPRVVNNTNIVLSNDELSLLNKGPKYNLHSKRKNWLHTLAFETDAAISHLPTNEQEGMRYLYLVRNVMAIAQRLVFVFE
jgi:hypothetical protein